MTTITKEQAQKIIDAADDVISALAGTNDDIRPESGAMVHAWDYLNDVAAPPAVVRELARIALASLEAKTVYQVKYGTDWRDVERGRYDDLAARGSPARIVYTAPPAPVVPDTLPCPVHLEPGLKFGKGVRTQCVLDALRRRAEYYSELDAMTPEQRAEHDARIAEFKEMLGNDGYAAMLQTEPVSPTYKLPAAQQQEAKR